MAILGKPESFDEDLKIGEAAEVALMDMCRRKGRTPVKVEGKFKGYDFFVAETKMAYEVKKDHKSGHTGNVVIEIGMYGKPSGLMSTIADMWIFDLPDGYMFIKPERIKDCVVENGYEIKEFVGNGDVHPKKAYLVRVEVLKKYMEQWIANTI